MGFCWHLRLCISYLRAENDTASPAPPPTKLSSVAPFRPGIAVVVGALTVMFSLTFVLLLYTKHCKRAAEGGATTGPAASAAARRHSGVGRAVVESLPIFRFGSLLGHKDGLECAVCLARFEPAEVLRLLPKCKHAFHVECVDTWLDANSTCPLCRSSVDPEDVLLLPDPGPPAVAEDETTGAGESKGGEETANIKGRRVSGRHSWAGEKSSNYLQIVLHRAGADQSRYRKSADSVVRSASVGCFDRGRKDGLLMSQAEKREGVERRFRHRIVVSGGGEVAQERWSDLTPSDLFFLRSEMIITDSGRYSVSRAGRASRCASEINGVSRRPGGGARREEEKRAMRWWLGFAAKRTARWRGSEVTELLTGRDRLARIF